MRQHTQGQTGCGDNGGQGQASAARVRSPIDKLSHPGAEAAAVLVGHAGRVDTVWSGSCCSAKYMGQLLACRGTHSTHTSTGQHASQPLRMHAASCLLLTSHVGRRGGTLIEIQQSLYAPRLSRLRGKSRFTAHADTVPLLLFLGMSSAARRLRQRLQPLRRRCGARVCRRMATYDLAMYHKHASTTDPGCKRLLSEHNYHLPVQ